jgi:hypothetical protein
MEFYRGFKRAQLQRSIGIVPTGGQAGQTEDTAHGREAKRPRLNPDEVDDATNDVSAQRSDPDVLDAAAQRSGSDDDDDTAAQQTDLNVDNTTTQQASLDDDSDMANPPSILEPQHIRASVTRGFHGKTSHGQNRVQHRKATSRGHLQGNSIGHNRRPYA